MEIEIEFEGEIEYLERTEDKVINEVLCYWDDRKGYWKPYTKKQLTAKFLDEQLAFDSFFDRAVNTQWH